ncbi:MAG: dTDP-4-dehydrorhamnose 3,5-epimerase [Saprospiraceae bacterium]|jgi:dTDP-4-dehydrorhamnose 3,5-epimerase|nr:dTDP-4-dehydrorhamnose 3,5-epimerase [Saprospiraceae bacterium]MBL0294338.1 dTDP-4-dehydrorhamnose 3,5-epimerase [Saprospiraceae bacterium]
MHIIPTIIEGAFILEPRVWGDERGYFFESFGTKYLEPLGTKYNFVQDNEAMSKYGVIRGLHYQLPPFAQTKLVRVVKGEVLDVIVDIRKGSPSYGQALSVKLNDANKRQLLVPKGMAHGYAVLSSEAIFAYKCDDYYHPEHEGGLNIHDPQLQIDWIIPRENQIISSKDSILPNFGQHLPFE